MRILPFVALATTLGFGSPFKTSVDRFGQWEATWQGNAWSVVSVGSGTWGVHVRGLLSSSHAGDLEAPRIGAVLAIPSSSSWSLEIVEDSGKTLSSRTWARVPKVDPGTGKTSVAPTTVPATSFETVTGSVRVVTLDLPLAALQSDGSLRVRTKLHVRVTWTGSVRPTDGTAWKNIVDNPGGIGVRSLSASRRLSSSSNPLIGSTIAIQVGDTAPFTTLEDGLVRLTGTQIYQVSGLSTGSISWSNVQLLSGSADTVVASNPKDVPAPGLTVLPMRKIDRNGDGILDANDEVWFWARGTSFWKADTTLPGKWWFFIHPYSYTRRYFLRLDANSASPSLGAPRVPASPTAYSTVWQPVWAGTPNLLCESGYRDDATSIDANTGTGWYWLDARSSSSLSSNQLASSSTSSLPNLSSDSGVATVVTSTSSMSSGSLTSLGIQVGSTSGTRLSYGGENVSFSVKGLGSSGNAYSLSGTTGFLVSGYSLVYQRKVAGLDSAAFPAVALGAVSIPVGNSQTCWVLEHGVAVRTCSVSSGALVDSATDPDTWYAVFDSTAKSRSVSLSSWSVPGQSHAITDPTATGSYDMVVIAPNEFMDVAESYASWRADSKQIRPMRVGILRAQDVWDLWSGGSMDPAAMRNALRWANVQWKVSHALLLGSGHVDPRGVRHPTDATRLPQWEDGQVSTDDYFTWFDTTGVHSPKIALGRVPSRSVSEAQAWLSKVEIYEDPSKATFGSWRNTITLAADDHWNPYPTNLDKLGHESTTEEISESMELERPWLRLEKVFEDDYSRNVSGMRPAATLALEGLLNLGTTGFNYLGHGASTILSAEYLLDVNSFQSGVSNQSTPYLFVAGSCTVGRHDDPSTRGLSELMCISAGKGSFAGIAGTRTTLSSKSGNGNETFVDAIWKRLLDTTAATPRTVGEAMQYAKQSLAAGSSSSYYNQELYNLLGDPALIPYPATLKVTMDSIPDSLSALSKVTVSGNATGASTAHIRLDHPLAADSLSDGYTEIVYPSPQQILSLSTAVSSDKYSTSILLPAKLSLGDSARFKTYSWDASTRRDGGAVSPYRRMAGTGSETSTDKTGPTLKIRSCDSSWTGGVAFGKTAQIPLPFCFQVDMQDSSGISSSTSPDEGVVFYLPGVKDAWHPDLVQGTDYRTAYAQLSVDSSMLTVGTTYTFKATARDLMGNLSTASLQILPQAHGTYALYDVFNSPNPVRDNGSTTFYFKLSDDPDSSGSVDTRIGSSIRIHTVSGKLIRVLRTELSQANQSRPRAVWDLKDSFGRTVANGLYPYTVTLRIPDAAGTSTTDIVKRGIVAVAR